MINYHNIVFPFLHCHGCRQEADSNFRDFARTSQIRSSIRQSRSLYSMCTSLIINSIAL